jgi:hypothetical protein
MKKEIERFIESQAAEIEGFNQSEQPLFSQDYQQKKEQVLNKYRKKRRKKHTARAAIVFAVIMALILVSCSKPVREIVVEIYRTFTSYFIQSDNNSGDKDAVIRIGYIPSGFELKNKIQTEHFILYSYKNGQDEITITYNTADSTQKNIDNEHCRVDKYPVNGWEACIYNYDDGKESVAFMVTDGGSVEIVAKLSNDELVRILESVTFE